MSLAGTDPAAATATASATAVANKDGEGCESDSPVSANAQKKLAKQLEKQRRKDEAAAARQATQKAQQEAAQVDFSVGKYGVLPVNRSDPKDNSRPAGPWSRIAELSAAVKKDDEIVLRARVHNSRVAGNKLCFFLLRQQLDTVQAVLAVDATNVSRAMHKFAASIRKESLVVIRGRVVATTEPVKSCTVRDAEIAISEIHLEATAPEVLPFTMEDATRPDSLFKSQTSTAESDDPAAPKQAETNAEKGKGKGKGKDEKEKEEKEEKKEKEEKEEKELLLVQQFSRVHLDTRLNNRVLDLRTNTNHAIFRIQSGVCALFREFLLDNDFIEIHTPKLLAAASEGGASVFEVKYFQRRAYLAQSPQFYKQMMVAADFPRVFEIGPVFRAEPSNTHRHMTEYTGVDLEMALDRDYTEVLDFFDRLFRFVFKGMAAKYAREIEIVRRQHDDHEGAQQAFKVDCEAPLLRLRYPQAVQMLREAGTAMEDDEDLSTEKERILGRLVRDRYDTDFFMLEKYPLCCRPFYTMPCPEDPKYSNSYDFFMRGEEIMSGAQRVHDPVLLEERLREHGVDPASVQGYLDAFKFGAPPHAGGGIGLERIVMLYLCLNNIRRATLFPRDPTRLEP